MNVQETSREAFYTEVIPNLGERQKSVLEAFGDEAYTNLELSRRLGWEINCVTPRVLELRQKGLIDEHCRRPDEITGRRSVCWVKVKKVEQGQLLR
mgnify:CR=1 FL=1